jgi:tetratricopeptide (TPR) repeat protein
VKKTLLFCLAFSCGFAYAENALQSCQKAFAAGDYPHAAQYGLQAGGFEGAMCAGRAQQAQGDYAASAASFAEAERNTREPFDQMLAITYLARATQAAGKVDEAIGHYERSLKIAREVKEKQAQMINLNEIGQLLLAKGDKQAALKRFKEAYPLAANDNERSECNQRLAAAYSQLGEHDRAIEHQLKSVVLEERSGEDDNYLEARLELGAIAIQAKDYARAQKEIEESLKLAHNGGSTYWESKALFYLGRLEKALGNNEHAQALFNQALELANKMGAKALSGQISAVLKE